MMAETSMGKGSSSWLEYILGGLERCWEAGLMGPLSMFVSIVCFFVIPDALECFKCGGVGYMSVEDGGGAILICFLLSAIS